MSSAHETTRGRRDRSARRSWHAVLGALVAVSLALPATAPAATAKRQEPQAQGHETHGKGAKHQSKKRRKPKPRAAFWGAWIGTQLTGTQPPWDMTPVSIFASLVGKGPSLLSLSSPFADCPNRGECDFYPFPVEAMDNIRNYGAIPFFNWASQSTSAEPSLNMEMPDFQLSDVLAGTYDSYIREFATAVAAWGHPFFLRFNWEMNGNWFPWAESVNGNQPGESIAVWRHVHDIFASVGATNATWVWCPYVDEKRRFQALAQLYPGDAYVNWTCLDGFNWASNPTNPHPWRSFDEIFSKTYKRIVTKIAPSKPMVLAEFASTGGHRAKARWIKDMFEMLATKYRRIRGLIWFDQFDRGINWPLETSPAATRAFAKGIRHKAFQANIFAGTTARPITPPGG
jgi:glycosyl hydrolase family 26